MKKIIYETLGNVALFLGPTGVSALNVDGFTIHSILHINLNKKFQDDLKGVEAHEFSKLLENVKIVIIDEYILGVK